MQRVRGKKVREGDTAERMRRRECGGENAAERTRRRLGASSGND